MGGGFSLNLLLPTFVKLEGLIVIGACGVFFLEFLMTLANLSPAVLELQLIKKWRWWLRGISCHLSAPNTSHFLTVISSFSLSSSPRALDSGLLRKIQLGEGQQLIWVTCSSVAHGALPRPGGPPSHTLHSRHSEQL